MANHPKESDRRSKTLVILVGGLCLLLFFLLSVLFNLKEIAAFLIVPNKPIHADIAIVLSGGTVPRVLAARDLYKNGSVRKILLIPESNEIREIDRELERLGIQLIKSNELTQRILETSQIPKSDIMKLHDSIDGTINEAKAVKAYLENEQLMLSLTIVTSELNSRRQCYIFRNVLIGFKVQCYASPYTKFDIDKWWNHPRRALNILIEYLKFTANIFLLLIYES